MTSNHSEQARAHRKADAHAWGTDDASISSRVESVCAAWRQDDMPGPISVERIGDGPLHRTRRTDLRTPVIPQPGRSNGNPMLKPMAIGGLDDAHVARWQSFRDQTLARMVPSRTVADRLHGAAQRTGVSPPMRMTSTLIDRGGLTAVLVRAVP
jgi:hemoglobin